MLTPREQQVLDRLKSDPMASQQDIADRLGMSRSSVAVHISNLSSKGVIRGRGYVIDENPYVVSIGGANVDITGQSDKALRRDDSNPGSVHVAPGGVARNVAENLVRLGNSCRLISIVGEDSHGDMLLSQCRERGLLMDDLIREPGSTTSIYIAVMNEHGELETGISSMGILEQLDSAALKLRRATIEHARAMFIDANLGDDALRWLFREFASKLVIADPVSTTKAPGLRPYLEHIDILKPSLAEAGALLGKSRTSHRNAGSLASELRGRGVGEVYLSLGPRGVYVASDGVNQLIPAQSAVAHVDVSGAGDAMTAAIIQARLDGHEPAEAAARGLAASGILMSARGASSTSLSAKAVRQACAEFQSDNAQSA